MKSALARLARHIALAVLAGSPMLLLWWGRTGPIEPDGYFHLAIAREYVVQPFEYSARIREGALAHWQADREPLFHLLLAGLLKTGLTETAAAMVVTSMGAVLLGLALQWHTQSVLGAVCGLFASHTVIYRLHMCRPHTLAVGMVVLGVALLVRGKARAAAGVNLVYTLSYSVPVLLLGAAILRSLFAKDWRPLAWVFAASVAGLLLHPHLPANVVLLWYQGYQVVTNALLGNRLEVQVPEELLPWSLGGFATEFWLPIALLAVALFRRCDPWWLLALLVGGLVLTLRMRRLGEYWVPLVALTSGDTLRWLLPQRAIAARTGALVLLLLVTGPPNVFGAYAATRGAPAKGEYKAVGEWLASNAPGEYVFNADWDSYGELRYRSPTSWWTHGQDPVFLAAHDPQRHRDVMRAIRGQMGSDELSRTFGVRYVLGRGGAPLAQRLKESGAPLRFTDGKRVLLELSPHEELPRRR